MVPFLCLNTGLGCRLGGTTKHFPVLNITNFSAETRLWKHYACTFTVPEHQNRPEQMKKLICGWPAEVVHAGDSCRPPGVRVTCNDGRAAQIAEAGNGGRSAEVAKSCSCGSY